MAARKDNQTKSNSKLARKRLEAGLTQEELATRIGISPSSLVRLERRVAHAPPLAWLMNAAIVLGVDLGELLEDEHKSWTRL